MSTLLHIDSSPLYGRSVSRELTAAFVTQWKACHPMEGSDRTSTQQQCRRSMRNGSGAVYTPEEARTPQQKELLRSPTRCSPNWKGR